MNTGVDERQKFEGNPQFDRKPIKLPDDLSAPFSQNCHSTTTSNSLQFMLVSITQNHQNGTLLPFYQIWSHNYICGIPIARTMLVQGSTMLFCLV